MGKEHAEARWVALHRGMPRNLVSPSRLQIKAGQTPASNCLGRMTDGKTPAGRGRAFSVLRAQVKPVGVAAGGQ